MLMFSMQIVSNERGTVAGGELVNPSVLMLGSCTQKMILVMRQRHAVTAWREKPRLGKGGKDLEQEHEKGAEQPLCNPRPSSA